MDRPTRRVHRTWYRGREHRSLLQFRVRYHAGGARSVGRSNPPMTPLHLRRACFDGYVEHHSVPPSLAKYGIRFTCPCCGFPTLGGRSMYEICFLCFWEDEGQDDNDADEVQGGPNGNYSLEIARLNFERYLVMYSPDNDTRAGGSDSPATKAQKHAVVQAFEEMFATPGSVQEAQWAAVRSGERELFSLLKVSSRE